ncbi:MAG: hypothetical protein ACXWWU_09155, partial [Candidatus Limnocylindria bacterium]
MLHQPPGFSAPAAEADEAAAAEPSESASRPERGPNLLATLLREELARDDHPSLIRLGDADRPLWWLRQPELSETPLADRVEWATFSILTTAGRLDENG